MLLVKFTPEKEAVRSGDAPPKPTAAPLRKSCLIWNLSSFVRRELTSAVKCSSRFPWYLPPTIVKGTTGPATVVEQKLGLWTAVTGVAKAELAAGTPPEEVPDRIVAQGLLADQIIGYDPEKMRILMQRMTSLALTGE